MKQKKYHLSAAHDKPACGQAGPHGVLCSSHTFAYGLKRQDRCKKCVKILDKLKAKNSD